MIVYRHRTMIEWNLPMRKMRKLCQERLMTPLYKTLLNASKMLVIPFVCKHTIICNKKEKSYIVKEQDEQKLIDKSDKYFCHINKIKKK